MITRLRGAPGMCATWLRSPKGGQAARFFMDPVLGPPAHPVPVSLVPAVLRSCRCPVQTDAQTSGPPSGSEPGAEPPARGAG